MKILWTQQADLDLESVESYIGSDNPIAAVKTVLKIIEATKQLIEFPKIGRPGRVKDTRELIVTDTPYLIPYRVKDYTIEILRVLHGARRWPRRF